MEISRSTLEELHHEAFARGLKTAEEVALSQLNLALGIASHSLPEGIQKAAEIISDYRRAWGGFVNTVEMLKKEIQAQRDYGESLNAAILPMQAKIRELNEIIIKLREERPEAA